MLDLCRAHRVDFILGLPTTSVLRRHVAALEASTTARAAAAEGAVRRFKEFHDAAASWSRVERIVARVEAGPRDCDTRFVVTSLTSGAGRAIYEKLYCARGQAENHIKAWKAHLAADRTSCTSAAANQLRVRRVYLQQARPANAQGRTVFVRCIAPHHHLGSSRVSSIVADAARRADLGRIHPHRLRHTAAMHLLRAGASSPEIGQLLRHRCAETTAIYAKVDRDSLRMIARPWPGDVQ